MSTTQISEKSATEAPSAGTVETKLEVVILPVSDVERSKRFYMSLGWRLDADFTTGDDWRARAADTSGLTVLRHLRQGIHGCSAGFSSGNVSHRQ